MTKDYKHKYIRSGMVMSTTLPTRAVDIVLSLLALLLAFCCFIPLWHVLMSSVSDGKLLLAHEGLLWQPVGKATLDGYKIAFADSGILTGYMNTLIYVLSTVLFGVVVNVSGGYVLSRESKARPALILFITFTMLFSGGLIPMYMVIRKLGMVGTRWALMIPGCTNGFFLLMMMNAFRSVPESTIESARIDGAGHMRVMFQIMLPQARSMLVVVILNTVVLQWNAWFPASIYVPNKRDLWPLQLWIRQLIADNAGILLNANPDYSRWLVQYAVIIAATLPILIAFPFFQKRLEAGMIMGAVKE